jgi:hypothetical protein
VAARAYELDFAVYPPGDGLGSVGLVHALRARKERCAYFVFNAAPAPDVIAPDGNTRSPVHSEKLVCYRCPGLHPPGSFDLWCEDLKGRADGIYNWEK